MKKKLIIGLIASLYLVITGCEKVIDIDWSDSKEVIVIEASISNKRSPLTILVSKTTPYTQSVAGSPVSGAKVSIRRENGSPLFFQETAPGIYELDNVFVSPGQWYIVDVEYEEQIYSARSFMSDLVPIADLQFTHFDGLGFFDSGYRIVCFIHDPENVENYYRIKYFVNGKPVDDNGDLTVYSDKLFNGKLVGLNQGAFVFKETDTVAIELQTIDKAAYDYFTTLRTITGAETLQSASPANPISNFSNGALGYFSAYTYERRRLIVKDYVKH